MKYNLKATVEELEMETVKLKGFNIDFNSECSPEEFEAMLSLLEKTFGNLYNMQQAKTKYTDDIVLSKDI